MPTKSSTASASESIEPETEQPEALSRVAMATQLLAGMLANPTLCNPGQPIAVRGPKLAEQAVELADALAEQLS